MVAQSRAAELFFPVGSSIENTPNPIFPDNKNQFLKILNFKINQSQNSKQTNSFSPNLQDTSVEKNPNTTIIVNNSPNQIPSEDNPTFTITNKDIDIAPIFNADNNSTPPPIVNATQNVPQLTQDDIHAIENCFITLNKIPAQQLQILKEKLKEALDIVDVNILNFLVSIIAELILVNQGQIEISDNLNKNLFNFLAQNNKVVKEIALLIPLNESNSISIPCENVEKLLNSLTTNEPKIDLTLFDFNSLKIIENPENVEMTKGKGNLLLTLTPEISKENQERLKLFSAEINNSLRLEGTIPPISENTTIKPKTAQENLNFTTPTTEEQSILTNNEKAEILFNFIKQAPPQLHKPTLITTNFTVNNETLEIKIPVDLHLQSIEFVKTPDLIPINNPPALSKIEEFVKLLVDFISTISEVKTEQERVNLEPLNEDLLNIPLSAEKLNLTTTLNKPIPNSLLPSQDYLFLKIEKLFEEILSQIWNRKEEKVTENIDHFILKEFSTDKTEVKKIKVPQYLDIISDFKLRNEENNIFNFKGINTINPRTAHQNIGDIIMKQILEGISSKFDPAKGEVRITLKPENLGDLQLKVKMDGDAIITKIIAHSYEVKAILENNFSQLKNALENQGLKVDKFTVFVNQDSHSNDGSNSPSNTNTLGKFEIAKEVIPGNFEDISFPYQELGSSGFYLEEYSQQVNFLA